MPGEAVNAFLLNPYWGSVTAVPTVLKPARVLSCENKLQDDLAIAGSKDIKISKKELIKNF